jgi:integrase
VALTDLVIRKAKPALKPYKIADGNGLWLHIKPNGSKLWRLRFTYFGKETSLSLGKHPAVSLSHARNKAVEARKLLQENINPVARRREDKRLAKFNAGNSFRAIAEEWFKNNKSKWTEDHGRKLWRRLELHIFPAIGKRPVGEISTLELLEVLRITEADDKLETTHKALQTSRAIFRYAVLTQRIKYNPANDLQGTLKAHKEVHYPTIGHNQLPEFLERLEAAKTSELNIFAIKLLMLTFVRQGELRQLKWSDINFNNKEWRIRPETTKMRTEHHVPLSDQAMAILKQVRFLSGASDYAFPSQHTRRQPVMSENTINGVIHKLGYKGALVAHGFRSMASTILNEHGFRGDVIERQLAHMPRDKVRSAYNRAEYLPERRQMMQWWGAFLEDLGL